MSCFLQPLPLRTVLDFGPWEGRGLPGVPGRTSQQYQKLISPNRLHFFLRCPPHTHCIGASEFRDVSSFWNLISPGSCSPLTSAHSRENQEPRLKLARRSPSLLDAGSRLDPGGLCSCLGSLCWISSLL